MSAHISSVGLASLMMFIAGFLSFSLNNSHLLTTLIALEFIALSLFLTLTSSYSICLIEMFNPLFYLVIAVCEGTLGLSIMVVTARKTGNDILASKNTLQW